jgi:uncharacterized protein
MLDELCEDHANLVFSFQQTVGANWRKDRAGRDSIYLQALLIKHPLRDASPNIHGISELILKNPHQRLRETRNDASVDLIRNVAISGILSAINHPATLAELPARHPLRETSFSQAEFRVCGRYFFPTCLHEIHHVIDVDTPENRFVKYFLAELGNILERFKLRSSFLNPVLKDELQFVSEELERFGQSSLWHEVGEMRFIPTQSTVLQRRDGYQQLFCLYSLLQMASRYDYATDKFDQIVELKDIPAIYEYWCFFR